MGTPIAQLLRLNLAFDQESRFCFFHGPAIHQALAARLRNQGGIPESCFFLPVESGRVRYQKGDHYHLGVGAFANSALSAGQLAGVFRQPPPDDRKGDSPLGRNVRVVDMLDCVTGETVPAGGEPTFLELESLSQSIAALAELAQAQIRLSSPLLLRVGRTMLDGHLFPVEVFLDEVLRSVGSRLPGVELPTAPPGATLLANRLVRADARYPSKALFGACGSIVLAFAQPLGLLWARALLLGGLVGVGRSVHCGQGRYAIVESPLQPYWPPSPAATFCQRAARPHILSQAREAVRTGGPTPGVDNTDRDEFLDALTYREENLAECLGTGSVKTCPLRGILLEKPGKGIRGLAIPTIEERFLQRACVEELNPAVDQLLDDRSFAYRKGRSRRNAELAVRRQHDEGLEHVLDADIRAFFDMVDWDILAARLEALLGPDPIVDLLMRWVRAPVEFAGRHIPRTRGLPQGAVISPMLANLYLDAFDEAMEERGFPMVRYADDFVVFARTSGEVARARAAASEELERLKLSLAADKTRDTTFDHGFAFLGYMFCRSVALEISPDAKSPHTVRVVPEEEWLDGDQEIRALAAQSATGWLGELLGSSPAPAAQDTDGPEVRWRAPVVTTTPTRRPVYVVDQNLRLSGGRHGLLVYKDDELRAQIAWEKISEVAVIGGHRLSPSLIHQSLRQRIPVAFYSRSGQPLGLVLPDRVRSPSPLTITQWRWAEDKAGCLSVARVLIEAKIHNQRLLLADQPGDNQEAKQLLSDLASAALRAGSPERLRGIEGQAAHAYFSRWKEWVAPTFSFPGRQTRGAADPVNALLNFLYTQLFRTCWIALLAEGLDPYLGVMHEGRGRYAALAADLQEPFRFLCDRLALELIHRGSLVQNDFVAHEKQSPPVMLKPGALQRVILDWETRLARPVAFRNQAHTFREHIMAQAERLAAVVRGERADMDPFRLKW